MRCDGRFWEDSAPGPATIGNDFDGDVPAVIVSEPVEMDRILLSAPLKVNCGNVAGRDEEVGASRKN